MMNNKRKYRQKCSKIKTVEKMDEISAAGKKRKVGLRWALPSAAVAVLICILVILPAVSPETANAKENLMDGIAAQPVNAIAKEGENADFINAQADFSVKLFKNSVIKNKNSLVSPVSVSLALGMAANGAKGETLKEFEKNLGGGLDINSLDRQFARENTSLKSAKEGKINIANSIWYDNKGLSVKKRFSAEKRGLLRRGRFPP